MPNEAKRNLISNVQAEQSFLLIPRRPNWDSNTTPQELEQLENENFLSWRRQLAELEKNENIVLTPFERNIEFWRQLWRVVERSDIVVQILDARNPLLFLCKDLQKYVNEVSEDKLNVILLNKGDFLTNHQRKIWAKYFDENRTKAVFFSALQQSEEQSEEQLEKTDDLTDNIDNLALETSENPSHLLSKEELLKYFKAIHRDRSRINNEYVTVGLVGYPNVGKSSTINAIFKCKRVSVSATPGKTKHFQTLFVDDELMLCDCPGLVFPNVVSSKAEMIINGILSIDQMTDPIPPVKLITSLIPRHVFESIYNITIPNPHETEDPNRPPTAEELLNAYGYMRGFMTHRGLPDTSRASRYILKDFVNGKLLYCYASPGFEQKEYHVFPQPTAKTDHVMTRQQKKMTKNEKISQGDFDKSYFGQNDMKAHSKGVHGITGYTRVSSDYTTHCGDSSTSLNSKPWKKHHNKNKKEKLRRVYAHLDE